MFKKTCFTKLFLYIFITSLLFGISCQNTREQKEPNVISNSAKPFNPYFHISLVEDFRIQDDWCDSGSIYVDKEENILYWVSRDNTVYKIDNKGNIILKKKFEIGQGYGDIYFFDFYEWDGNYYVFDKMNMRLNILDKQLNVMKVRQLNVSNAARNRYILRLDESGNQYYISEDNSFRNGIIYSDIAVSNYGKKGGRSVVAYYKQSSKLYENNGNRMISYFYHQPFLRYLIGGNGAIWLCNNREYRIYKYFPDGSLDKIIENKYEKIEIKGEIEEKFREEYQIDRSKRLNTEFVLPAYLNPLIGILAIDENYIFVLRSDYLFNKEQTNKILIDIFDLEGHFLCQAELPKYYGCYNYSNQYKPNIYYKNGNIYTLEADKDMMKFSLVKYVLSIKE